MNTNQTATTRTIRHWSRRIATVAATAVAGLTVSLSMATAAHAATYTSPGLDARMECLVHRVEVQGAIFNSSGSMTNDGVRDWALFEFYHYTGAAWVSDGYSTYMYNDDGAATVRGLWYEYRTNLLSPSYSRSYPVVGTWVAVKIWLYSGRDGNWYTSWAQPATAQPTTMCQIRDLFCTAYECYPTVAPPAEVTVGGNRPAGVR